MPSNSPSTIDGRLDEIDSLLTTIHTSATQQRTPAQSVKVVELLNEFAKAAADARDKVHPFSSMSADSTTARDGPLSSMSADGCLKIIDPLVSAIRTSASGQLTPRQSDNIFPLLSNLAQVAQNTLDAIKKV